MSCRLQSRPQAAAVLPLAGQSTERPNDAVKPEPEVPTADSGAARSRCISSGEGVSNEAVANVRTPPSVVQAERDIYAVVNKPSVRNREAAKTASGPGVPQSNFNAQDLAQGQSQSPGQGQVQRPGTSPDPKPRWIQVQVSDETDSGPKTDFGDERNYSRLQQQPEPAAESRGISYSREFSPVPPSLADDYGKNARSMQLSAASVDRQQQSPRQPEPITGRSDFESQQQRIYRERGGPVRSQSTTDPQIQQKNDVSNIQQPTQPWPPRSQLAEPVPGFKQQSPAKPTAAPRQVISPHNEYPANVIPRQQPFSDRRLSPAGEYAQPLSSAGMQQTQHVYRPSGNSSSTVYHEAVSRQPTSAIAGNQHLQNVALKQQLDHVPAPGAPRDKYRPSQALEPRQQLRQHAADDQQQWKPANQQAPVWAEARHRQQYDHQAAGDARLRYEPPSFERPGRMVDSYQRYDMQPSNDVSYWQPSRIPDSGQQFSARAGYDRQPPPVIGAQQREITSSGVLLPRMTPAGYR